jgi:hypothetical protein
MKNKLYKEFASYYADVTNDRDFKAQLELILSTFESGNPCISFLELFAGQSLHSIEALKKPDIDVWAIDSSSEMKQIALAEGFKNPAQYIVGDLPEAILSCPDNIKFDCITCLYNGLSILNIENVFQLLKNCRQKLSDHGKMFVEMHDIFLITEYLSNPQIRYTEVTNSRGELIKYAWPSGKIKWSPYNYRAEVPVQFLIQSSQRTDTIEFTSYDHIYSTEHIIFLAGLIGFEAKILTETQSWAEFFGGSIILELSIKNGTSNS